MNSTKCAFLKTSAGYSPYVVNIPLRQIFTVEKKDGSEEIPRIGETSLMEVKCAEEKRDEDLIIIFVISKLYGRMLGVFTSRTCSR